MNKKLLTVFFGISLLLTACGETAPDGRPESASPESPRGGEVIRMGYIGPLTGDVASLGQDEKATIQMWAKNNMIDGKQVEVVFEDGKCNGQEAASAAQKLIAVNKVQVILGGACSGETLGAAPVAEKKKVVLFSSGSSSPEVSTAGDYVFRNVPSDAKNSVVLTRLIAGRHQKVALLTQANDYASAYRTSLLEKLPAAGVEVVVDEVFNSGTTDFKTVLQKVKDSEAQALVIIPGEASPGGFIVKQAKELSIDLPVYGGDALDGKEFFEIGKDATEGLMNVMVSARNDIDGVSAFFDQFEKVNGHKPSFAPYMLLNWDKLNILKQAIEEVGYDGTKIKDYLYQMPTYSGLGGETKFDANGDVGLEPSVMIVNDGKFVQWMEDMEVEKMEEEKVMEEQTMDEVSE